MVTYKEYVELVQNDFGNDLEGQITDADDQPFDLTGFTLKVIVREVHGEPKFEVAGIAKIPYTNGEWYFVVEEGHFDEGDKLYNLEVELTRAAPAAAITAQGAQVYVKLEEEE